jgi:hypothetical protein
LASSLAHLPALRRGRPYASLDSAEVRDCRSGEPLARISQVNAGIIRKDFARVGEARAALKKFSTEQLLEICKKTADIFLNATLPLGDQGNTSRHSRRPAACRL